MPAEFYPHAAYFTSIAEGWVAGLNGFIYYTKNSGNTWHKQSADSTVPIYQFQEIDGVLFALGDNATVLKLTGDQWKTVQPASAPIYLRAALYFKQKLLVAGIRLKKNNVNKSIAPRTNNGRLNILVSSACKK